ncbi:MAG: CarD family transcriptional regulator [Thermodesulfobacteriota bacterium]
MFKIGDLAVYPAHGVGKIASIENKAISGKTQKFYIIQILESGAKIMIPVDNAESVGLRRIVDKSVVLKVYAVLKERSDIVMDNQTWNRRYREYMNKIKTGCVIEVAKVLRDIYLLKTDKDLSFGERKMMDTARNLLIKELSIAKKTKEDRIEKELDRLMSF